MMRIALALFLLSGIAAAAQTAAPPAEADGRFTFDRVAEGYLRLDSRSGQVSLCSRRTSGWTCEAVPEDRAAMEGEIAKLQAENSALKQALEARGLPLPNAAKAERPPQRAPDIEIRLPSSRDIERAMGYLEQVWRRLVEALSSAQKDVFKI